MSVGRIGNNSVQFFYYLRAGKKATRPITDTALSHKENSKIPTTKENTHNRGNKSHT